MSNMVVSLLLKVREEGAASIGKLRDGLQALGSNANLGEKIGATMVWGMRHAVAEAHNLAGAIGEARKRGGELANTLVHGTFGVAAGLAAFKVGFLDIAVGAEDLKTRLEGLEGTPGRAESAYFWLKKFRDGTATTMADVTQAWIELREHGVNPLDGSMQAIADAATVTGHTVAEVAAEFGNVVSEHGIGRMRALGVEMIDQGGRIGVKYHYLGKIITESFNKFDKNGLERALVRIMGLLHDGAAQKASDGWVGTLMKMRTHWEDFALDVMEKGGVLKFLTAQLNAFRESGDAMIDGQKSNAAAMADTFKELIRYGFRAATFLRDNLPAGIEHVKRFVGAIGGVKVALGAVVAFLAGPFIFSLLEIGIVAGGFVFSAVTFLASALASLAIVIGTAIIPAIYSFGAALLATPIGWIIGLVALLILVGYELYAHWSTIMAGWGRIWQGMKFLAQEVWGAITSDAAANAAAFMAAWQPVKAFFEGLWTFIKTGWDNSIGLIASGIDKVKGLLPSFGSAPQAAASAEAGISGAPAQRVDGRIAVDIKVDSDGRATGKIRQNSTTGPLDVDPSLGFAMSY